jgi:hypothetical protein
MRTIYSVTCMMCGRASGQLCDGTFSRVPGAPAPDVRGGQTRCGFCGGSLYLELEDTLSVSVAANKEGREARRLAS